MSIKIEYNPYIIGQPVKDPKLFFGRDEILQDILNRLQSSSEQNMLLIHGQRRIGKSSLLYQVVNQVRAKLTEYYLPVLVDLMGSVNIQRLMEELARRIADALGMEADEYKNGTMDKEQFREKFLKQVIPPAGKTSYTALN